jgi:hypothetical protein
MKLAVTRTIPTKNFVFIKSAEVCFQSIDISRDCPIKLAVTIRSLN